LLRAFVRGVAIAILVALLPMTAHAVKVDAPPPTFTLIDDQGRRVDMKTLLDRPSVIYFTHNACHYCTQIIAMLKRADQKFGRENLRIIGINVMAKDKELVKVYKEELGFIFPMLAGNRGDLLEAYEIAYVPKLVFIDGQMIVRKVIGHYIHEPELHENIKEIMAR
jgi:peroxiredoxin